jgi:hypothetical protein
MRRRARQSQPCRRTRGRGQRAPAEEDDEQKQVEEWVTGTYRAGEGEGNDDELRLRSDHDAVVVDGVWGSIVSLTDLRSAGGKGRQVPPGLEDKGHGAAVCRAYEGRTS